MTLEILKIIISLCAINALEDTNGKWTELHKIEKYQKDCRTDYIKCYEKEFNKYSNNIEAIKNCILSRSPNK